MSKSKWFRVVGGMLSIFYLINWVLLATGVWDTPSIESIARNSVLALALAWGIIAGMTK